MGDIAPSLKFPLSLLQSSGIYYKNRLVRNIAIAVYIGGLLYIIILAGMQFLNNNGNIFRLVGNLEAFCSYLQQFGKVIYLIYYNKKLLELLDSTRGFQSLFNSKEYTLNITIYPIQKMHLQLQKMFILSVFICLAYIIVASMLTKTLPLGVWNLKQYGYWYTILLNLERILLIPTGFIVTAADTIFLAFCVEVLLQFRQLNFMIRALNTGNGNFHDALKWNIRHQLYLLWIMAKVENFYLPILAVQYLTIVPLICTEMYAICEGKLFNIISNVIMDFESMNLLLKQNPTRKSIELEVNKKYPLLKMMVLDTKYGPNIKIETPEFFCFIPNRYYQYLKEAGVKRIQDMLNQGRPIYILRMGAVSKTAGELGSALYSCAWYTTYQDRQWKELPLVIQKSQQAITFKACGFVPIDARTILAAGELGSALYSCAWYTTYQDRQWKELPLVIQKSQQAITFKACGFVPIDARTILAVVKMSWSACCVIRAMKRKVETA